MAGHTALDGDVRARLARLASHATPRSHAELTPTAFFFDNEANNFTGCEYLNVHCIKVHETEKVAEDSGLRTDTRELCMARTAVGVERFGAGSPEAQVLATYERTLVSMNDFSVFYDPNAGIVAGQVERALTTLRASDVVALDFYRCITVIEGFLFPVHDWKRYRLGMINIGMSSDVGADDIIRTHLGGEARARMIARGIASLIERVGARNVYVLTNNRCVLLVERVMQWLSDLHASSLLDEQQLDATSSPARRLAHEPFAPNRVVSTHYTPLGPKAAVLDEILKGTSDGTIDATLQWRECAAAAPSA